MVDANKIFEEYLKGNSQISKLYLEAYGKETDMPEDLYEKIKTDMHKRIDIAQAEIQKQIKICEENVKKNEEKKNVE